MTTGYDRSIGGNIMNRNLHALLVAGLVAVGTIAASAEAHAQDPTEAAPAETEEAEAPTMSEDDEALLSDYGGEEEAKPETPGEVEQRPGAHGCGCRTAPSPSMAAPWIALLGLAGIGLARRSRRRQ
jgi:MYXO-CTERM domain-containing protein